MVNEYLKNAIKNKVFVRSGLFYVLYLFKFISKHTLGRLQMESIYYRYKRILNLRIENVGINYLSSKTVWVLWFQGFENAPQKVKECIDSIYKYLDDTWNIVLLDDSNLEKYVELPKEIISLRKTGKLSLAALSDIIRLYLLSNYGGIWMDSTCLLEKPIPQDIIKSDFFVFRSGYNNLEIPNFQSWFIVAKKNHPIVVNTYRNLVEYVIKYKGFPHYFFMFFVFQLVTEKFHDLWDNMLSVNEIDAYNNMFNKKSVRDLIFMQKVTYK